MNDATEDLDALFEQAYTERVAKPAPRSRKKKTAPATPKANLGGIVIEGDLTVDRIDQAKAVLLPAFSAAKAASAPLKLDMSAVTTCDGAGLQLLLALNLSAHVCNVRVEMLRTPPGIAALFDRYNVTNLFAASGARSAS